jgi:hypothetical protein
MSVQLDGRFASGKVRTLLKWGNDARMAWFGKVRGYRKGCLTP